MSEPKLLAEWFWTDRYDGSSAALMNMECQGVYRTMLSRAWRAGAKLPNDHEAIQRAIRCTPEEWARAWPKVARYWRVDGDSLVNDTQLEIYAEAKAGQERASERATAAASKRWAAQEAKRAQAMPEHMPKQSLSITQAMPAVCPPSPSPSPSPSPVSVSGRTTDGPCGHPLVLGRIRPGRTIVCPDCGEEFTGPTTDHQPKPNPFVAGKRVEYEREALRLTAEISELTGEDGAEIFAQAAHYEGALRQKVNPANLSDDRLLNTVLDLRASLKDEQAKRAKVTA